MKRIRVVSVLLAALFIFMFAGCGDKQKNAVNDYFKDIQNDSITFKQIMNEVMNQEMDSIDIKDVSRRDIDEFNSKIGKKYSDDLKKIAFKINDYNVDGKNATVNVTVIGIDYKDAYKNQFVQAVKYIAQQKNLGNELSEDQILEYIDNLLDNCTGDLSKTERTGDIHLEKQGGKWKVVTDESLLHVITGMDYSIFDDISASN